MKLSAAILAVALAHVVTIGAGAVNEEYLFAEAAQDLQHARMQGLDQFFEHQANTLGVSALTAGIGAIVGMESSVTLVRSIVLILSVLFVAGSAVTFPSLGFKTRGWLWAVVLMANPIVWCMLGYGTADLLPGLLVTQCMLGCTLVIQQEHGDKALSPRISGFPHLSVFTKCVLLGGLFAIATGLKIHSIWFAVSAALALLFCSVGGRHWLAGAALVVPSALVLAGYGAWTESYFDFFIVPDHFKEAHFNGWLWRVPVNAALYVAFSGCLLGPVALAVVITYRWDWVTWFVTVTGGVLSAWASTQNLGEMNFGALSNVLPAGVGRMIFFAGGFLGTSVLLLLISRAFTDQVFQHQRWMLISLVLYLLAISFSRPAQRYLIFVFPILLLFCLDLISRIPEKRWLSLTSAMTVLLFLPVSLLGQSFLASQGNAAQAIAEDASRLGVACQTDFSLLRQHVGDRSRWCPVSDRQVANGPVSYKIVGHHLEPTLATTTVSVFGYPVRTYRLVRIKQQP